MDYKTTAFDVEANGLNYYLGIKNSVDIDYWVDKKNQYIEWRATIIHSPQGISNIHGYALGAYFWLRFRVDLDDLTTQEEEHLISEWEAETYNGYLEGQVPVSTYTDKDWKIEFSVEFGFPMIPKELQVNFMDKYMEVI